MHIIIFGRRKDNGEIDILQTTAVEKEITKKKFCFFTYKLEKYNADTIKETKTNVIKNLFNSISGLREDLKDIYQDIYVSEQSLIRGYDMDFLSNRVFWENGKWVDPYVVRNVKI